MTILERVQWKQLQRAQREKESLSDQATKKVALLSRLPDLVNRLDL
jgi:hypothetical protein